MTDEQFIVKEIPAFQSIKKKKRWLMVKNTMQEDMTSFQEKGPSLVLMVQLEEVGGKPKTSKQQDC